MKRYRFRLEAVLRVRRLQEDAARGELARAAALVSIAEGALGTARGHLSRLSSEAAPADPGNWEAYRHILLAAAAEVSDRKGDVAGAIAERGQCQRALADARTRVRALERLDARRRDEHAVAAVREETRVVDDLVSSRHRRATAGAQA